MENERDEQHESLSIELSRPARWACVGLATCASSLPPHLPLFLYSSRDDDVVPFAHTERYAAELPGLTVRVFDSGGHQFGDDLAEVARDIRTLRYRR